MSLPHSVPESEFLAATSHIAKVLYPKFGSVHGTADDFAQQVALWALEASPKFDPAVGTFGAFAYRHARNRAMNALRDRVSRRDPPCASCHAGTPCRDSAHCPAYGRWFERNRTKANLNRPLSLCETADAGERPAREPTAEALAKGQELAALIDRRLPVEFRADYLRLLAGETVPKPRRERVQRAVRDVLDDPVRYDSAIPSETFEELDDVSDDADDEDE